MSRLKKIIKRRLRFIFSPLLNGLKKNHKIRRIYARYYDLTTIKKNFILYESRDGHSITDSPYAIFKYLLRHDPENKYTHIWSITEGDPELNEVAKEYSTLPNVHFVVRNSRDYLKLLAEAEFLITNSTFQTFFVPKKGQKYINTWHGTPLKTMGFDIPGNPAHSQNVLRNFLETHYLLSPNAHTTQMYAKSYKLDGLYNGEILESGYPRIDLTLNMSKVEVLAKLKKMHVHIDPTKKIFLYTPTWKGSNVNHAQGNIQQIIAEQSFLEQKLGDQYNVLIKVHPFLYPKIRDQKDLRGKLIPDVTDTNELLSIVDLLVTDYSSIFFDYLVTDKPIIFYCWDKDLYDTERGMYIKADQLPGPTAYNVWQLVDLVQHVKDIQEKYKEAYQKMKDRFVSYEDGHATERYVTYIFEHKHAERINIIRLNSNKKKILVYPGGMKNNGITSSFINLTNNIDYKNYDVTLFMNTPRRAEVLNNLNKVNPNVRMLFKPGIPIYKLNEIYRDKLIQNRSLKGYLKIFYPKKAYKREVNRLMANQTFDISIDFSGYSYFWAKYIVEAKASKKICFMHNDVKADSERTIGNRHPHLINLRGIFSLYDKFDKLLSVSKATMELNKKKLKQYAPASKFDYTVNTIDPQKILNLRVQKEASTAEALHIKTVKFNAQFTKNCSEISIWPELDNIAQTSPVTHRVLKNDSVFVIAEAVENDEPKYCKILINSIYVGWIEKRWINYLQDEILDQRIRHAYGSIQWPGNNYLWSKPYDVPGCTRISNVKFLKNVLVRIKEEAITTTSTYNLIAVKNQELGWLDANSIQYLGEAKNVKERLQRTAREWINHIKHHKVITALSNRTLEEERLSLYGRVVEHSDRYTIWNKPYPNYGYKEVCNAADFAGVIVNITKKCMTRAGIFYFCNYGQKTLGWLDAQAIRTFDESELIDVAIEEKVVHYSVKPKRESDHLAWAKPVGFTKNEKVTLLSDATDYLVRKEIQTNEGTSLELYDEGGLEKIGYIQKDEVTINENELTDINGEFIGKIDSNAFNFISMGRLSPEKNQKELIKAVAKLAKEHSNVRLYILGSGPLKNELLSLISELSMEDKIFLLGQVDQPFRIMRQCDCFVLSSIYEGQPMVLLEAMTLGMKIIASNIVANAYVLNNGTYGLLTEGTDAESIYKALKKLYDHPSMKFQSFDYRVYNNQAINEFYKKINE
ncbi:CDP-glycerol glycerophosphotransferase family protein [Sporolactobacillus sp. CPB3-1]|uniref:CDP-glycerol glycerophosphotransferase family protein n=1 Tax=Sporolactobacillus mangiferae TaxID=2940498 RepID=A0ABT0MD02_9BACL|nr:CDP-glycerol glycerophosphotransferase family protein [Sporolactobacillus mangiferae]MCL1632754.1 CDP-glycerol glycerophosphotransferase family protein [Sporolactobacillus mangiferae]